MTDVSEYNICEIKQ